MKRQIITLALLALFLLAGGLSMLLGSSAVSLSERRPLAQWPELNGGAVLNGSFMTGSEKAAADQFPMRDSFRSVKAGFLYYCLGKLDNNELFRQQGHICKLEYPLREGSVSKAGDRMAAVYQQYLLDSGSACYFSIVPDKNRYLDSSLYPVLSVERMQELLQEKVSYSYIDITDSLKLDNYYATDPHWKQETIIPVANLLLDAMGANSANGLKEASAGSFHGSYAGQYALPVSGEPLNYLDGGFLAECSATDLISGKEIPIYNEAGAIGQDPYDLFLGGAAALQVIENPNAPEDKELLLFRDSFGSSIAPLLAAGYRTVTLIDLRYISSAQLSSYVDFHGQDVLFLYSTLVLNHGESLR